MTVANGQVGLSYPKPRGGQEKFFKIFRTDTTASVKAALPKDAIIMGSYIIGGVASNAGTAAQLDVGTTATATELIAAYPLHTAAGEGYNPTGAFAVGSAMGVKLTDTTNIYGKYTESGTASSTGGPWIVKLEYFVPGPGEQVDD